MPTIMRDVNSRLDAERRVYKTAFERIDAVEDIQKQAGKTTTRISLEIEEIKRNIEYISQRLDEHAKTDAMHTIQLDSIHNRMREAADALTNHYTTKE